MTRNNNLIGVGSIAFAFLILISCDNSVIKTDKQRSYDTLTINRNNYLKYGNKINLYKHVSFINMSPIMANCNLSNKKIKLTYMTFVDDKFIIPNNCIDFSSVKHLSINADTIICNNENFGALKDIKQLFILSNKKIYCKLPKLDSLKDITYSGTYDSIFPFLENSNNVESLSLGSQNLTTLTNEIFSFRKMKICDIVNTKLGRLIREGDKKSLKELTELKNKLPNCIVIYKNTVY